MPMGIGLGIGVTRGGGVGWWPVGSALSFEFDNQRGFNSIDRTKTTPDSILTYTNPSAKLVYGSDGVLRYAPHNLVRAMNAIPTSGIATAYWFTQISTTDGVSMTETDGPTVTPSGQFGNLKAINITTAAGFTYRVSGDVFVVSGNTSLHILHENSATGNQTSISGTVGQWVAFTVDVLGVTGGGVISAGIQDRNAAGLGSFKIRKLSVQLVPNASTFLQNNTTAAVYSLPIDHNPTTFEPLGVLIEEQRVNLFTYSEQAAQWGPSNSTTDPNVATAPDAQLTGDRIIATTSSGYVFRQISCTAGLSYTQSIYLKKDDQRYVSLVFAGTAFTGGNFAFFDIEAGIVVSVEASITATIQDVGNGWFRCSATKTAANTATGDFRNQVTGASWVTGTADSWFVWGWQLEAGSFPTSYVPTVASQVTRLADQVSILTSAFAWENATGTFYVDANVLTKSSGASGYFAACAGLGGNSNTHNLYRNANVSEELQIRSGNSTVAIISSAGATGSVKMAYAYAVDDYAISKNGGAVGTDPLGPVPVGVDRIQFGTVAGGNYSNGTIKRLTYFPTRRTNADLQVLTRGDDLVWGAGDYLVWGSGNNLTW